MSKSLFHNTKLIFGALLVVATCTFVAKVATEYHQQDMPVQLLEMSSYVEADSIELLIQKLEHEELSKQLVQVLEYQIDTKPDPEERSLSLNERRLMAHVVGTIFYQYVKLKVPSLSSLSKNPENIKEKILDLSEKDLTRSEKRVLKLFASLENRGALEGYLQAKLRQVSKIPAVGSKLISSPEALAKTREFAVSNIRAMVESRGLTDKSLGARYVPWKEIINTQLKGINEYKSYGRNIATDVEILVDGPESFGKRKIILENAKRSIDILVWAIEDDLTGEWLKEILLRKHRQGVRVRIVVDGQVSERPGYGRIATELKRAGIQLINWTHNELPFVGQHRKLIIADQQEMIAGGLNFGDRYSHLNPKTDFWKDTDFYSRGPFVSVTSLKYFEDIWNSAAGRYGYKKTQDGLANEAKMAGVTTQGIEAIIIDHSPETNTTGRSHIIDAMFMYMKNARTSIDISNAYIIATPALVSLVKEAVQRGVKVRIFTNSDSSVDEPAISGAMLRSVKKLKLAGADVYLRQKTTLHSKFLIVDAKSSFIMSYNLHPRSERLEGEVAFLFEDQKLGADLTRIFEKDIHDPVYSKQVGSASEIKYENSIMQWLLMRLMYDLL